MIFLGYALIAISMLVFACFVYAALRLLLYNLAAAEAAYQQPQSIAPPPPPHIRAAFDHQWYYVLLCPLLVPVIMVFGYINWFSMKWYRHS